MLHQVHWKTRLAGIAAVLIFTGTAHAAGPAVTGARAVTAGTSASGQLLQLIDGLRSGAVPSDADIQARAFGDAQALALAIAAFHREINQIGLGYAHRRFPSDRATLTDKLLGTDDARDRVVAHMGTLAELIEKFDLDIRVAVKRAEADMAAAYAQTPASVRRELPRDIVSGPIARTRKTLRDYIALEKARQAQVLSIVMLLDLHRLDVSLSTDPTPRLVFSDPAVEKKFRAQTAHLDALTQRLVALNFLPEVQLERTRPKFVPAIQSAPPASSAAGVSGGTPPPNPYAAAQFGRLMRGVAQGVFPSDGQIKVLRIGDMEAWVLSIIGFNRGMYELGTRHRTQLAEFEPGLLITAEHLLTAPARQVLRGKLATAATLVAQYDLEAQALMQRSEVAMTEAYAKIPASDRSAFPDHFGTLPLIRMRERQQRYVALERQQQAETLGIVQLLDDHPDAVRASQDAIPHLEFLDDALLKDYRARVDRIDALSEAINALIAGPAAQDEQAGPKVDDKARASESPKP